MAAPIQDFGRVLKALFRFARYVSFGVIGLMVVFLAFRVAEVYRFFAGIHVGFGIAFLAVFAVLVVWLIGRPLYRFWKVPAAMKPPVLPPMTERTSKDLAKHLVFVERYLRSLLKNPEWEGSSEEVATAIARCETLRKETVEATRSEIAEMSARIKALEDETVSRLLEPLDRKAREVIRQESLAVGIATAVSWNGTMDAFLVLWRNCNLVSRVARIYYGRPGPRGTLSILRDVSGAAIASAYLQDLSEAAGTAMGSVFGKTVGMLGGPLLDGGMNALATLRIGYVAKARCRAFSGWNERTRAEAVMGAVKEAGRLSKDVMTEIVKAVGGGLLKVPGKAIGKLSDAISGIWKKGGDEEPEPAGA